MTKLYVAMYTLYYEQNNTSHAVLNSVLAWFINLKTEQLHPHSEGTSIRMYY